MHIRTTNQYHSNNVNTDPFTMQNQCRMKAYKYSISCIASNASSNASITSSLPPHIHMTANKFSFSCCMPCTKVATQSIPEVNTDSFTNPALVALPQTLIKIPTTEILLQISPQPLPKRRHHWHANDYANSPLDATSTHQSHQLTLYPSSAEPDHVSYNAFTA